MTLAEIPPVSINEPWQLDKRSRKHLVDELVDLAEEINGGEHGSIPPGMPSTTYKAQPAQGVLVEITFTRPGPLPGGD